jgi:hypothetical protein
MHYFDVHKFICHNWCLNYKKKIEILSEEAVQFANLPKKGIYSQPWRAFGLSK